MPGVRRETFCEAKDCGPRHLRTFVLHRSQTMPLAEERGFGDDFLTCVDTPFSAKMGGLEEYAQATEIRQSYSRGRNREAEEGNGKRGKGYPS